MARSQTFPMEQRQPMQRQPTSSTLKSNRAPPQGPKRAPPQARTVTTVTSPEPVKQKSYLPTIPHIPIRHHHAEGYTQRIGTPDGKNGGNGGVNGGRPGMGSRQDSMQTRYMGMLLGLDDIPRFHNILASFFTWILLAGFIIFPGTYTTITSLDNKNLTSNQAATLLLTSIKHTKLLVVASVCSGIGTLGMIYLWRLHSQNYVWLLQRIFLPGCLNSLAGFISTLISVYGQQNGKWSITARVTEIVIGSCMVVTGSLFAVYNWVMLGRVKREHEREMGVVHEGETLGEKMNKPAFGSVV